MCGAFVFADWFSTKYIGTYVSLGEGGGTALPERRAILSVNFTIERLRTQTASHESQIFPGDHCGPRKWLALILGILDTAEAYLNDAQKPGQSRDAVLQFTQNAAGLGAMAYSCLRVMSGASIEDLPYPTVRPLQRWFDNLSIPNTVFFRAEVVANYELRPFERYLFRGIKSKTESLEAAIGDITWPVYRVTVPGKAFGILPHFAIVAHEIGHALYEKINWDLSALLQDELIGHIAKQLGSPTLSSEDQSKLQEIFDRWFEEIAADAIALYLAGPAAFFALGEFLELLGGGYGISTTHPANALRRRALYDKLSEGAADSFSSVFKKYTNYELTEDFNSKLLSCPPDKQSVLQDQLTKGIDISTATVISELHEFMPSVVPVIYGQVHEFFSSNIPDTIYTPQTYAGDLEYHMKAMLAAIPPIEQVNPSGQRTPTDFASILNIGWVACLTKLGDLRVRGREEDTLMYEKLERLHGLILKAVELSEASRIWREE